MRQNPEIIRKMHAVVDCLEERAMGHIHQLRETQRNTFSLLEMNMGSIVKLTRRCIEGEARGEPTFKLTLIEPLQKKVRNVRGLVINRQLNRVIAEFSEGIRCMTRKDGFTIFQSGKTLEELAEHFTELGRQRFEELEAKRQSGQGRGG